MADHRDIEARFYDLEWRLTEYHERLEASLEHDRRFQLNATWGIVTSWCAICAAAGAIWLVGKLDLTGWVEGIAVGFAALAAWVAGASWAERGKIGDIKKLSRLPTWKHNGE